MSKNQLGLAISLIITCTASFLITIN